MHHCYKQTLRTEHIPVDLVMGSNKTLSRYLFTSMQSPYFAKKISHCSCKIRYKWYIIHLLLLEGQDFLKMFLFALFSHILIKVSVYSFVSFILIPPSKPLFHSSLPTANNSHIRDHLGPLIPPCLWLSLSVALLSPALAPGRPSGFPW